MPRNMKKKKAGHSRVIAFQDPTGELDALLLRDARKEDHMNRSVIIRRILKKFYHRELRA